MKTTIDMAREVYGAHTEWSGAPLDRLEQLVALVRADEREAIKDEWWMCVQSDLENGVKSLNEQAATKWRKEYPEIAKFGAWLNAKGENT
jgi:hypothetical protein